MALPNVLLTNPIHPAEQARLSRVAAVTVAPDVSPQTLRDVVANCDAMIVRSHLPHDIFEYAPRLRYVVRHGVGLDMVPMQAATDQGIAVANLPGANTQAVVEYVLSAMFNLRRNLIGMDQVLREEGWTAAKPMSNGSVEIGGSVLGIVGYGSIGQRLAQITAAMGMQVLVSTRRPETVSPPVVAVDFDALLSESDFIVLACPHNEQTHHLIDQDALSRVKRGALLINVARGPVVDTEALISALSHGSLAGAALDVHEPAILTGKEAIFSCPTVQLTPHIAGITATSLEKMSRWAVDTTLALLRGERPNNVVNSEVFARYMT